MIWIFFLAHKASIFSGSVRYDDIIVLLLVPCSKREIVCKSLGDRRCEGR